MTTRNIRVFVSSVSGGLEGTRNQIIQDLNKAGYDVSAMERFGAQPTVPLDVCLNELRNSDAVVLIIGPRYGSLLPQGISYTHAEFERHRVLGFLSSRSVFPITPTLKPRNGRNSKDSLPRWEVQQPTTLWRLMRHWNESRRWCSPRFQARVTGGISGIGFLSFRDTNDTSRPNWSTLAHSLATKGPLSVARKNSRDYAHSLMAPNHCFF